MTTQSERLAEAHLQAYERRQIAARAWLNASESHTPADIESLRRQSDAEAPTGATIVWMLLMLAGAAAACVLLYFRAPLWRLVNVIPWWAWLGAALFLVAALWRRS